MAKIAVIYWSGSGNTEKMAKAIAAGAKGAGAEVGLFEVEQFSLADTASYDGFCFGCPAMGDEVLEESVFEPFFSDIESELTGVPVALFGSYGWGSGTWMRLWVSRAKDDGAKVFDDGLILENEPDDEGVEKCKAYGAAFAGSF